MFQNLVFLKPSQVWKALGSNKTHKVFYLCSEDSTNEQDEGNSAKIDLFKKIMQRIPRLSKSSNFFFLEAQGKYTHGGQESKDTLDLSSSNIGAQITM